MNNKGKGKAVGSLVCGIIAIVLSFSGFTAIPVLSLILGMTGLVLASLSKKDGYNGGMRRAGFILSLIGLIFGAIIIGIVICVIFIAAGVGAAGTLGGLIAFIR